MKKPLRVAPLLQRKVETGEVGLEIESGISAIIGGGQPLAESTRSFFEPRFGSVFFCFVFLCVLFAGLGPSLFFFCLAFCFFFFSVVCGGRRGVGEMLFG